MNSTSKKNLIINVIFCLVLLVIHGQMIFSHSKSDPDAKEILQTIWGIDLSTYVSNLLSWRTLDVQPLRDLTLRADLFFFQNFDVNTFVFQNFLWWFASLICIKRILNIQFPQRAEVHHSIVVFLYSLYPLFSMILVWGMARKHLMSFFFILVATSKLVQLSQNEALKNRLLIISAYLAALFSQPIAILWPLWATFYLWQNKSLSRKNYALVCALFLVAVSVAAINILYYSHSPVFLKVYTAKSFNPMNLSDQVLALGHYISTLVFPYFPAFHVTLGHWTTLFGLLVLVVIMCLLFKYALRPKIVLWLSFIFFPLLPVLLTPQMLQDTYLLLPSFGALMLIEELLGRRTLPRWSLLTVGLLWMIASRTISQTWMTTSLSSRFNFRNAPNCLTAFYSAKIDTSRDIKPLPEVSSYLDSHECAGHLVTNNHQRETVQCVESMLIYYSSKTEEQKSIELAIRKNRGEFCALTYLLMLNIDGKRKDEAKILLGSVVSVLKLYPPTYTPAIKRVVIPFCLDIEDKECLAVLKPYTLKPNLPYD